MLMGPSSAWVTCLGAERWPLSLHPHAEVGQQQGRALPSKGWGSKAEQLQLCIAEAEGHWASGTGAVPGLPPEMWREGGTLWRCALPWSLYSLPHKQCKCLYQLARSQPDLGEVNNPCCLWAGRQRTQFYSLPFGQHFDPTVYFEP